MSLRMLSHGLGEQKLNWGVRLSGLRDRKLWLSPLVTSTASLSYLQGGLAEGQRRPPPSSSILEQKARATSAPWWLWPYLMRGSMTPRVVTGITTPSFSEVQFS